MSNYNKLNPDDYVPYAPEGPGTISMAHQHNCDNGTDHKPRLAITRESDGVIKAFCHNCQSAGVWRPEEYVRSVSAILEPDDPDDPITLPKDAVSDTSKWPNDVLAELFKYDITYEEIEKAELCYSPSLSRLIIPIYNKNHDLMRWEGRGFFKATNPKYIKQRVPGATDLFRAVMLEDSIANESVVVITEDYVSAIRVARHLPAVALGGVALPEEELIKLSEEYDHVIVALDDDNPQVLAAARQIAIDAGPLFKTASLLDNPDKQDPKRYDRIEILGPIIYTLDREDIPYELDTE